MNNKIEYLKYIHDAKNTVEPLKVSGDDLLSLEYELQNVELLVPVVGGFSAGKSSLINSFLEEEVLATAITPETALATELRYAKENYIESIDNNGVVIKHSIEEFSSLKDNAKKFQYLRVYLEHDRLKAIHPLVLVDMPGFDSPIDMHNKAILNYLNRGVYFVFLTSVEEGNISRSMKREIDNLYNFGKGFSFCISKTDLRPPEDVRHVKEQISEQLIDFFDFEDEIMLLDQNGGKNLDVILKSINPDSLIELLFLDRLKDNYLELIETLNVKISTFKVSQKEADDAIRALQGNINEIVAKKESAIQDVERRYSNQSVKTISDRVTQSLMDNRTQLIELALNSPHSFTNEVNEIVKNSLLSNTQEQFTSIGSSIIKDVSAGLKFDVDHKGESIIDNSFVDKISNTTEKLLNQARGGLSNLSEGMNEKAKVDGRNVYRAIATIVGVTTSVIAPVIEIIVIFLPDIISLFTKEAKARKAREQVEKQIVFEVIPSIKEKINSSLPAELNEQIASLISDISEQFERQLDKKQVEIKQASDEKKQIADDLTQEIETLESAKQSLSTIANRHLFNN
ncbi:dynamin family protein [Pseudoalteromonas sp. SA25]|uniref:dynamin family protein n=1 Tax=Pseudoalteromonas sp. SA25 TaxID=2686347 RepID=UPI0013FE2D64|nr:dynamin family protein [Pseudoalteromonas sp. SA25]